MSHTRAYDLFAAGFGLLGNAAAVAVSFAMFLGPAPVLAVALALVFTAVGLLYATDGVRAARPGHAIPRTERTLPMWHPFKQRPFAVAFDGVFLVLGTHDTEAAVAVLRSDPDLADDFELAELGSPGTFRGEWLEPEHEVDYWDWLPVEAGTPGAVPVLILE